MKDFSGKVALITGAARGFGKELAREAFSRGMRLFLADIDEPELTKTTEELRQLGAEVEAFAVDVSLESGVDDMVRQAMLRYSRIDLLINNAGVIMPGSVLDVPAQDWEWVIQTNCMSQVYAMKRVIPIMEQQGTPCYIVNVSSAAGLVCSGQMPAYSATKHFSVSVTESVAMALEERGSNVSVSLFCPSFVQTNLHNSERYRPKRYQNRDDPYYSSEAYRKDLKEVQFYICTGHPLKEVGAIVFKGLDEDQFYIYPHAEGKVLIKSRLSRILNGRKPDLQLFHAVFAYGAGDKSPSVLKIIRDALKS